jgi:hypothetical protein
MARITMTKLTREMYQAVYEHFRADLTRVSRRELAWVAVKLRRYAEEDAIALPAKPDKQAGENRGTR